MPSANGGPSWTQLDLDDHVGVRGALFRTKKGEVTVRADELTLLVEVASAVAAGQDAGRAKKAR